MSLLNACKTEKDSFTKVESETSQLINGLKSYSSVSEVINNFFTDSDTTILFNSRLPDGDRRPPYNIIIISISNYDHLNENGELELYFFNDRLMSTTFYPDSITYYVEELKKNNVDFNVDLIEEDLLKNTLKVNISSYTEISLGKNYQKNKYYVCWVDVRLVQEEIRWISKYAHLRMPNQQLNPTASPSWVNSHFRVSWLRSGNLFKAVHL
jgi:hypothetical protein